MHRTATSCKCSTVMRHMSVVVGPVQMLPAGDRVTDGIACTCTACGAQYVLLSQTAVRAAAIVSGWLQDELRAGRDPIAA